MIRYGLDDLGWYQFEWLAQSLLKAELGLGVESWGGSHDHGRDAWCDEALPFPARHSLSEGPFLFQAKFIQGANAAGAKVDKALLAAVSAEAAEIRRRILARPSAARRKPWREPAHYVLLTNAPLSARLRTGIAEILRTVLPNAKIHPLGGTDICDMLDCHPPLRRSFPQLLGLRDLEEVLQAVVNKENVQRSAKAVELARDVSSLFVPTGAYRRAWEVLRKHHFVVLEGPPEMGKTAIAWMIALVQVADGWEAVLCDEPEQFFQRYGRENSQIFIADDAFGRTEYDPSRGRKWERRLDEVLRATDRKHWLVWTSRKHILERAVRAMDLTGTAEHFPKPAAVLVDAGKLDTKEKALILYRHARAAQLAPTLREAVRFCARQVVSDVHFTPERIRHFVREALPGLEGLTPQRSDDRSALMKRVGEAIRNPTDRMRKSFKALHPSHKWLLISFLEAGRWSEKQELFRLYREHCPQEIQRPPEDVFDELGESFLKPADRPDFIDWTHPSYRDLVIEELATDLNLRNGFLGTMALPGIKLAISDAGGATGSRRLPLMTGSEFWGALRGRCQALVREAATADLVELLTALASAVKDEADGEVRGNLLSILADVCEGTRVRWNESQEILGSAAIVAYREASLLIHPLPPMPNLRRSWDTREKSVIAVLQERESLLCNLDVLEEWATTVSAVAETEPRMLRQLGFPETSEAVVEAVVSGMLEESEEAGEWDDYNLVMSDAQDLHKGSEILRSLCEAIPSGPTLTRCREAAQQLEARAQLLKRDAQEMCPPDEESDSKYYVKPTGDFDIEALFADL